MPWINRRYTRNRVLDDGSVKEESYYRYVFCPVQGVENAHSFDDREDEVINLLNPISQRDKEQYNAPWAKWFIHPADLDTKEEYSLEHVKRCLQKVDSNLRFKKVFVTNSWKTEKRAFLIVG